MYKITITKTEEVEVIEKEYQKVADTGNERDDGAVYEYVMSPSIKQKETTVLIQSLDEEELDLKAVVKAINRLG